MGGSTGTTTTTTTTTKTAVEEINEKRSLTLSSALSRIRLSGEAPSRWNHWSSTRSGSDSSSLTGTTREPMGRAQLWDSWPRTGQASTRWLLHGTTVWIRFFVREYKPAARLPLPRECLPWGREPGSRTPHSTWEQWCARTPFMNMNDPVRLRHARWVWIEDTLYFINY